jgi:hypothetical protein
MRSTHVLGVCFAAALAPFAMAQKWEFGGGVGGGFYTSQDVSAPGGSASAKIGSNLAGGIWVANNSQSKWGGELRFDYQLGSLELNGGGSSASFAARSYGIHYDVLWYAAPNGSRVRPFVSGGVGAKVYVGTGAPSAFQPLSNYALLTHDQDILPMISAGGGVKMQVGSRMQLRVELHDYMTPFPKRVITPNTGAKIGGWLQDFVPSVGISFTSPEGR